MARTPELQEIQTWNTRLQKVIDSEDLTQLADEIKELCEDQENSIKVTACLKYAAQYAAKLGNTKCVECILCQDFNRPFEPMPLRGGFPFPPGMNRARLELIRTLEGEVIGQAADTGNLDCLKLVLGPQAMHKPATALDESAVTRILKGGHLHCIGYLIDSYWNSSINSTVECLDTILPLAYGKDSETYQHVLQKIQEKEAGRDFVFRAFHNACYCNPRDEQFISELLKSYGDLKGNISELICALSQPLVDMDLVELLVNNGSEINSPEGSRPTLMALTSGQSLSIFFNRQQRSIDFEKEVDEKRSDVARYLIERGAIVNISYRRVTPLLEAVQNDLEKVSQVLVESGAFVNCCKPNSSMTPLLLSILNNNLSIFNMLLEAGALVGDIWYTKKQNPICGNIDAAHSLINLHEPVLGTTYHISVMRSQMDSREVIVSKSLSILKQLIKAGAGINELYLGKYIAYDVNPLLQALRLGLVRHAQYLLQAGGDTSVVSRNRPTEDEFPRVKDIPVDLLSEACSVMCLVVLARNSILRSVTYPRFKLLSQLPLPRTAISNLKFADLDDIK